MEAEPCAHMRHTEQLRTLTQVHAAGLRHAPQECHIQMCTIGSSSQMVVVESRVVVNVSYEVKVALDYQSK